MTTLAQLLVTCKEYLLFPNTAVSGNPNDTWLTNRLQEANKELYGDLTTRFGRRFASVVELTVVAGTESYDLSDVGDDDADISLAQINLIELQAEGVDNKFRLMPLSRSEWERFPDTGMPQAFAVEGTLLYLCPAPTTGGTLYIHVDQFSDLTTSGPVWLSPLHHHVVAMRAAYNARRLLGDPVGDLATMYQEAYNSMVYFYENTYQDTSIHEEESDGSVYYG